VTTEWHSSLFFRGGKTGNFKSKTFNKLRDLQPTISEESKLKKKLVKAG